MILLITICNTVLNTQVLVLFIVYLCISVWGACQMKTGLKLESSIQPTSYLGTYLQRDQDYFAKQGPSIMFIIDEPQDYRSPSVRKEVCSLIKMPSYIFYSAVSPKYYLTVQHIGLLLYKYPYTHESDHLQSNN